MWTKTHLAFGDRAFGVPAVGDHDRGGGGVGRGCECSSPGMMYDGGCGRVLAPWWAVCRCPGCLGSWHHTVCCRALGGRSVRGSGLRPAAGAEYEQLKHKNNRSAREAAENVKTQTDKCLSNIEVNLKDSAGKVNLVCILL